MPPPTARHKNLPSKAQTWVPFLLALLPIAVLVRLINEYGVNVPYGDEWSLIPLFSKWSNHQLTFADLFRQHNEHRIVFPKLIYLAFARWTRWNVRAEMFFSVLLCCGISACIYILLKGTVRGTAQRRLLLWALINLVIFSPVQAENWLWGFQLQVFIPTLCLMASLAVLGSQLQEEIKFGSACLLTVVATFSSGGGLLLWPAIGLYLILRHVNKRWLILWSAFFVLIAVVYFAGYKRQPAPGPQTGNPLDYLAYFLAFNGAALARIPIQQPLVLGVVFGASALALYLATFGLFLKANQQILQAGLPWLALGAYPICSAALAAYTRTCWGPQQALDSRYASVSSNLYVALIALIAIASQNGHEFKSLLRWPTSLRSIQTAFLSAILTLYIVGFPEGVDHMALLNRFGTRGLSDLQFSKVIKPPDRLRDELMIPQFSNIMPDIALLEHLRFIKPPIRHSPILHDGENRPRRSTPEFGRSDALVQNSPDTFEMNGWCFLPLRQRPPPCVVLAYRSGENWIAFTLSDIRETRPDIAKEMKSRKYLMSGWRKVINRNDLPEAASVLCAWTLDAAAGEVYKLPGDFALPAHHTSLGLIGFSKD